LEAYIPELLQTQLAWLQCSLPLLLLLNPRKFGRQAGRKAIRSRETQEDTQPTQPKQKSFQNFALLLLTTGINATRCEKLL
jgi:hypothetical protein